MQCLPPPATNMAPRYIYWYNKSERSFGQYDQKAIKWLHYVSIFQDVAAQGPKDNFIAYVGLFFFFFFFTIPRDSQCRVVIQE